MFINSPVVFLFKNLIITGKITYFAFRLKNEVINS